MKKFPKKILPFLLAVAMFIPLFAFPTGVVSAADVHSSYSPFSPYNSLVLSNSYLRIVLDGDTGMFTMSTSGLDMKPILCRYINESGYATICIMDESGNPEYHKFQTSDNVVKDSSIVSTMNISTSSGSITVKQVLSFASADNMAKIEYQIVNNSSSNSDVGIRIMLDPMVYDDQRNFIVDNRTLYHEEEFYGSQIPQYWKISDMRLTFIALGTIYDDEPSEMPDKVKFALWSGIYESLWDYTIDSSLKFSEGPIIADNAVAIYYTPKPLSPLGTKTVSTYYGVDPYSDLLTMDQYIQAIQVEEQPSYLPPPLPKPETESPSPDDMLDDDEDSSESTPDDSSSDTATVDGITLPFESLQDVMSSMAAINALQAAINSMTSEQASSSTGIDLITLYAEEAIAQAASTEVKGSDIIINEDNVKELQEQAISLKAEAEKVLEEAGINIAREIRANVKFRTDETEKVSVTIEPSATNISADYVRVQTPDYSVSFPQEMFKEDVGDSDLIVTIEETSEELIGTLATTAGTDMTAKKYAAAYQETPYTITISKDVTKNGTFSFKPASRENLDYQAVIKLEPKGVEDVAIVSKYNPSTGMIDAKIRKNGTYIVKENRKSFSDLTEQDGTMKDIIEKLASKGIINGTSATTFSPQNTVTRAELTTWIMRALSKVDDNPLSNFNDVDKTMWYYAPINSAKKYGIVNGTSETMFEPDNTIQKDQIVAIAARTLRSEMRYRNYADDREKYLPNFADRNELASWSLDDIAFAERVGLVIARRDGLFSPFELMTRGDAAMILNRLFDRVW